MAVDGIITLLFAGVATASTFLVIGRSRGWFSPKMTSGTISTPDSSISDTSMMVETSSIPVAHIATEAPKAVETIVIEAPKAVETIVAETPKIVEIAPAQDVTQPTQAAETKPKSTRRRATTRRTRSKKTAAVTV